MNVGNLRLLSLLVEVANTLNPPEGFLVQARSGPEDSSNIIGTFLDPSVVTARNPSIPVNYKILKCRSHQNAEPQLHEVMTCSFIQSHCTGNSVALVALYPGSLAEGKNLGTKHQTAWVQRLLVILLLSVAL